MKKVIIAAVIAILFYSGLMTWRAPDAKPENAPAQDFSAARASRHIAAIAQTPRPTGSPAAAKTRDYIVSEMRKMGIETEVIDRFGATEKYSVAARTFNIVSRLKGSGGTQTLTLATHYDSEVVSPGACDDGAGVAILLETARALQSGPKLKNDVVLVITDAEEFGLLGASAYLHEKPKEEKPGIVLNFEARGTSGPSILFETSNGNAGLIREFGREVKRPLAVSLSTDIYRRMPNDTDFTVFRAGGYRGYNFAFIENAQNYHTPNDSIANCSLASLQHQGDYALDLARHFGNSEPPPESGDAVYFPLPLFGLIWYPAKLALVFSFLALALVIAAGWRSHRSGKDSFGRILLGIIASLAIPAAGAALGAGAALLMKKLGGFWFFGGNLVFNNYYLSGALLWGFAASLATGLLLLKKISIESLRLGSMVIASLLALISNFYLPGGSYLFLFPAAFGAASVLLSPLKAENGGDFRYAVFSLLQSAPVLVLWPAVLYLLYLALGFNWIVGMAESGISGLLLVWLMPVAIILLPSRRRFWTALAAAVLGIALMAAGAFQSHFDEGHPLPANIHYYLNGKTGRAILATFAESAEGELAELFDRKPASAPPAEFFVAKIILWKDAPAIPLNPPRAEILSNLVKEKLRYISLRITPGYEEQFSLNLTVPGAPGFSAQFPAYPELPVLKCLDKNSGCLIINPPPGALELNLTLPADKKLLIIKQASPGLPPALGPFMPHRPNNIILIGHGDSNNFLLEIEL